MKFFPLSKRLESSFFMEMQFFYSTVLINLLSTVSEHRGISYHFILLINNTIKETSGIM